MHEMELNNKIKEIVLKVVPLYLQKSAYMDRKLTDTPADDFQVVARKYVNLYGTTRPASSVVGQHFFDTSLASGRGKDITWNGTGWVDGAGSYV